MKGCAGFIPRARIPELLNKFAFIPIGSFGPGLGNWDLRPSASGEHGSPVEPQTLEALIVHSIDTLDAHAEIVRAAWLAADPNANLIDAPRPLKGKLARSLKRPSTDD
jgi:hypothetical protein